MEKAVYLFNIFQVLKKQNFVQGISYWNVLFELSLTDRNTQARICLKVVLISWGADICVSSASFQNNDMGWPQQPPIEEVLKFNMIFQDSCIFFLFQNIKIKLITRSCMTLKSSLVIFQALKPLQPQWPLQPQQHLWPQWPLQPHSIKKITAPDDWIPPGNQMTNNSLFLWNG